MSYYNYYDTGDANNSNNFWANLTQVYSNVNDDLPFSSNYEKSEDISVNSVLTAFYMNSILFVAIMLMYEWLRRLLPSVYSADMKRQFKMVGKQSINIETSNKIPFEASDKESSGSVDYPILHSSTSSVDSKESGMDIQKNDSLPEVFSFRWAANVFDVSWETVRRYSSLDGYFFLRYIRMNLRICSVTCVWAFLILVPVYASGSNKNQQGWYHMSVANVNDNSWRLWVPSLFAYLFSGFIFFVMKQELRHFLELRLEFFARGTSYINPQHHYSLMVENIPHELRSEKALYDYFSNLFPNKVHSTSMVLNLPDLEVVATRCMRVCRRLEKSLAYYHATGKRATHNVGSPRMTILGIDSAPCCGSSPNVAYIDNRHLEKPQKGTHVDSISYYTYDLSEMNKKMRNLQVRNAEIALEGTNQTEAMNWFTKLVVSAHEMADKIMIDSAEDNALRTSYSSIVEAGTPIPQAELMCQYGTLRVGQTPRSAQCGPYTSYRQLDHLVSPVGSGSSLLPNDDESSCSSACSMRSKKQKDVLSEARSRRRRKLNTPGKAKTRNDKMLRRIVGRLGLDFVVSGIKFAKRQIDHAVEGTLVGSTMSSTGFVTFLDLTSLTTAASTPLTSKPQVLNVGIAPEPRDVIWKNAHFSLKSQSRRENHTNIMITIIGFLWTFPLTAIQAFAKADYIARIPGMEWILTIGGGRVSQFLNGYLPVAALLALTMILPVIFELLAVNYERRKTLSDVQNSMLLRYFIFQVLNLYISITAGSAWEILADIIDHPTNVLGLLGESMPFMVGYFVSLLVTKILVGLPIVFLRFGALSKMILRRLLSLPSKLTQRELDEMYSPENILYGWEFPTQIFVLMIIFTYAVICPVILPFGALYFGFSLIVYKKQTLYVYQSVYESGGEMFPVCLQLTLFALVLGQLTFIGYLGTRKAFSQVLFLLPLPLATLWGKNYFNEYYVKPSTKLSLERAREYDRVSEWLANHRNVEDAAVDYVELKDTKVEYGIEGRRAQFKKELYRQPVLTRRPMNPRSYRRGQRDEDAELCRSRIKELQSKNSTISSNDTNGIHSLHQKSMEDDNSSGHGMV